MRPTQRAALILVNDEYVFALATFRTAPRMGGEPVSASPKEKINFMKTSRICRTIILSAMMLGCQFHPRPARADECATASFDAPHSFAVGQNPAFISVADLNGDGKPDLVVA